MKCGCIFRFQVNVFFSLRYWWLLCDLFSVLMDCQIFFGTNKVFLLGIWRFELFVAGFLLWSGSFNARRWSFVFFYARVAPTDFFPVGLSSPH